MYSIRELTQTGKVLFHTEDLALIWNLSKKGTLHMRISRYLKNGTFFPIARGLYSIVSPDKISPIEIGANIYHKYCYLTSLSILDRHGVINGRPQYYIFAGETSKKFSFGEYNYIIRQLRQQSLFNSIGIIEEDGVMVAGLERAVADTLYFNPRFHFDSPELINFKTVKSIQTEVGYI